LSCTFGHQPQRPRPTCTQHEHQQAEQKTQQDTSNQQQERIPIGEHPTTGDSAGRLHRPPIV